ADDMGLGKTVQVIALLLDLKRARETGDADVKAAPCLLVVPASLIANWKAEIDRFAPGLAYTIVHPSEVREGQSTQDCDLVITTYGMLTRQPELRARDWKLVILDEAQAIKNAGTAQARAVKELRAA